MRQRRVGVPRRPLGLLLPQLRTVAEVIKALEWAGVLTWQNCITRIRERCCELFGREAIATSFATRRL